jgi:hypothetical protein
VPDDYIIRKESVIMAIRDIDFFAPSDVEILVRCKQFVERELCAKYKLLAYLESKGKSTRCTEIDIKRMEYALGIRDSFPNIKEMLEEDK